MTADDEAKDAARQNAERLAEQRGLRLTPEQAEEALDIVRESGRLMNELERLEERRARLMESVAAREESEHPEEPHEPVSDAHSPRERLVAVVEDVDRHTGRAPAVHCQDWPLCGHEAGACPTDRHDP